MVRIQKQEITYQHPFAAVTASLWLKYDGHKYVKEVDVLDRYVDEEGKLHSRRLLSMSGILPSLFKPFVPMKSVYMLESVVVDPLSQLMTVKMENINMKDIVEAKSSSSYVPVHGATIDSTLYKINIEVTAFPNKYRTEVRANQSTLPASQSTWSIGVKSSGGGYLAKKLEGWVANKLLGNVSKGEKFIDSFCQRWRSRHVSHCSSHSERSVSSTVESSSLQEKQDSTGIHVSDINLALSDLVRKEHILSRYVLRRYPSLYGVS